MRVKSRWIPALNQCFRVGVAVAAVTIVTRTALYAQASKKDEPIAPFSTFYLTTGTLLMDVSKLNPHFERTDLAAAKRR